MNPHASLLSGCKFRIVAAMLCLASVSRSVHPQTNAAAPAPVPAVSNDAPAQSVFLMPNNEKEGKDPFFPKSKRPYGSVAIVTTNVAPSLVVAVDLKLKAISGYANHRLALINNHTFEAGEEAEVLTSLGRTPIRCLEIKADSVIVQIGSERRELRMRAGF